MSLSVSTLDRRQPDRRQGALFSIAFALALLFAPRVCLGQSSGNELERLEGAFQDVIRRVSPSVVGIRAYRRYASILPGIEATSTGASSDQLIVVNGSGAVISDDGLLLTNEHVVQSAEAIEALFSDGRSSPAIVVGADARSDLAVLRVGRSGLTPTQPADVNNLARGQWAIVLGNPFGLGADGNLSVSIGVISNLGRRLPGLGEVDDRLYADMIQTTAAINPGNSGGPMFDIHGKLVGVVTAMHTRAAAEDGVGFAIPLTPQRWKLIEQLKQGKRVEYGFLGASVRMPTTSERRVAQAAAGQGVVIDMIDPEGPAARANLRVGDFVLAFNGATINGVGELVDLVGGTPVGTTAKLDVVRSNGRESMNVTIGPRQIDRVSWMRSGAVLWRGLRLADLTPETAKRMGVENPSLGVVVVDVAPGTPASRVGVQVGDVIERVANQNTTTVVAFQDAIRGQQGAVEVTIRGRGQLRLEP